MPIEDDAIRILQLTVDENKISWSLLKCRGVYTHEIDANTERLELSDVRKEAVGLLADLFRVLAAIRNNGELKKILDVDEGVRKLDRVPVVLGEHLYELLFKGRIHTVLHSQLEDAAVQLLRIELTFKNQREELAGWPWEYLRTPKHADSQLSEQFLALNPKLVLNRKLVVRGNTDLAVSGIIRILVVVANPRSGDLSSVECSGLLEKLKEIRDNKIAPIMLEVLYDQTEFSDKYQPLVTRTKFKERVSKFKPHVIHFIGHGRCSRGAGGVAFIGEDGGPDFVSDADFAEFACLGQSLKLVCLQACESALADPEVGVSGMARRLSQKGIPAVVAMQYEIENMVANAFSCRFYEMLAAGDPVDVAVKAGREAISDIRESGSQQTAFGLPVVYLQRYESIILRELQPVGGGSPQPPSLPFGGNCPKCNTRIYDAEQEFCTECPIRFHCKSCKALLANPLGKRCGKCGTEIGVEQTDESGVVLRSGPAEYDKGPSPDEQRAYEAMVEPRRDLEKELAKRLPGNLRPVTDRVKNN